MDLRRMIDHTLLKPEATAADIRALCEEAKERNFKAVCIPPRFVPLAKEQLQKTDTVVCTVIGFPLGFAIRTQRNGNGS
jgi:deoxyribose-phosphate aldolase